MINVGIDSISFYTSRYALDLAELARARGIDGQSDGTWRQPDLASRFGQH